MSMKEIAAKIERKQLLEKLDILEKLLGKGPETVSKEEISQVIKAREKELLEEIRYLEEQLGFQPYGLSEFLLHKEEDKLAAEEEYKDQLDDRYMALAKKFNVKPRKLLSHVLEYRIVV